jgi:hypothetical protein
MLTGAQIFITICRCDVLFPPVNTASWWIDGLKFFTLPYSTHSVSYQFTYFVSDTDRVLKPHNLRGSHPKAEELVAFFPQK